MVETMVIHGQQIGGTAEQLTFSLEESVKCPFCHEGIETQPISYLRTSDTTVEVFLKCKMCKSSFVGYSILRNNNIYHIVRLSKGNHEATEFNEEIKDISPLFVKIYGQAESAEHENLDEICGVGYRKALEFLIKDYLINKNSGQEAVIKSTSLGTCISTMIDNPRMKEVARRATWLGNDETHYFRKWEDKDLGDLKRLIQIAVSFISMELEADRYLEEMGDAPVVPEEEVVAVEAATEELVEEESGEQAGGGE